MVADSAYEQLEAEFVAASLAVDERSWLGLKGGRLLFTGATGFIGRWLLGTLQAARRRLRFDLKITVLSRDPAGFRSRNQELAGDPAVELVAGDVREVQHRLAGRDFSHVIHAATEASAAMIRQEPLRMIDTIVLGTRGVLELAIARPPKRMLFVSSGAVYGRQPSDLPGFPEDWLGGPDILSQGSPYHEGKRLAEQMCVAAAVQHRLTGLVIARPFAFIGPFLPLDTHFAAGNLIGDMLAGRPITVQGDGRTIRSYLYAQDMAAWTWTVILRGEHMRAYNIGSEEALTISELAETIARLGGGGTVAILGTPGQTPPDRYVPCTRRIRDELGVCQTIALTEALDRTIRYHRVRARTSGGPTP